MNIFEVATRQKIRFASVKGELSVEQLWDVPLRSKHGFDLDAVAKAASKKVRELSEESFVSTARTPLQTDAETALDVVKHVIAVKLQEEAAAEKRAANHQEREQLLRILAEKQQGALSQLSVEDIQKRIAALSE